MKNAATGATGATVKQVTEGTLITTPSGEKRIRLADLRAATKPENVREISLFEILHRRYTIEGPDDSILRMNPINLVTLSIIEEMFPAALSGKADTTKELIALVTVIANQDAPEDGQLTEDQVARMLNTENIPLVEALIRETINPLPVESAKRQTPTTPAGQTGRASSSGSRGSSGGTKFKFRGSR